jgi:UDP-N-acetyl-D-mannosaminuronate dehydrogenase
MNVLVLGAGAVGTALTKVIKEKHNVLLLDKEAVDYKPKKRFDVMHICYPYSDHFVEDTVEYITKFKPKLTLIESTVKPSVTRQIYVISPELMPLICHSPIRGKHNNLEWGIRNYTKFIGPCTEQAGLQAEKYYQTLNLKTYLCKSSLETECAKLLNLSYYAAQIAFFQEAERIKDKYGLNWIDVLDFFDSTTKESQGLAPRPLLKGNHIGGSCVMQGLNKLFNPGKFAEWINTSNRLLEEE